jgi:hypothetical protein
MRLSPKLNPAGNQILYSQPTSVEVGSMNREQLQLMQAGMLTLQGNGSPDFPNGQRARSCGPVPGFATPQFVVKILPNGTLGYSHLDGRKQHCSVGHRG